MAKVEVDLSTDLQESVQGEPVSGEGKPVANQENSKKLLPIKKDSKQNGKEQTILSNQLPSEINKEDKKSDVQDKAKDVSKEKNPDEKKEAMPSGKPSRWWIWILVAIFVLGGAAAAYFLLLKGNLI